ncbi:hypothetical protein NSMM_400152 [Nitrosomonas mobilis]|uniref:Uncharacterized protein n=1 Tax=Nitrosomonas mobilis TaxID=51642 RepID=A0A1G5SEQ2_9PROT|nr:hypothetical protein NSMM_400152 [Nitrosomonas mobilis]
MLHSDNGNPTKGAALLTSLQALGVTPSFSRQVVGRYVCTMVQPEHRHTS